MIRSICSILLVTSAFLPPAAQTPSRLDGFPSVSVLLPANIPSETVQISYFLIGPFGGYGGYTEQRPDLRSYEIATAVEGKAASEIRVISYASGCEIQTYVIPLEKDSQVERNFECRPVRSVTLSGQIVPTELIRDNNTELVVTYMAFWAHRFFGIMDGPVAEFRLATLSPDMNGKFQVDLPYFSNDDVPASSELRASVRLLLRDSKTWNHIGPSLEPQAPDSRSEDHNLKIQSRYPDGLKFQAQSF